MNGGEPWAVDYGHVREGVAHEQWYARVNEGGERKQNWGWYGKCQRPLNGLSTVGASVVRAVCYV